MITATGKHLTVKPWFGDKIANEVRGNIHMCDVFAILKQTEKAVYAMLSIGCDRKHTTWVPKSCLIEQENGTETITADTYEEAAEAFRWHWSDYK